MEEYKTPSAEAVKKEVKSVKNMTEGVDLNMPDNLAENEETCKSFVKRAFSYLQRFTHSSERESLERRLIESDRMFRMAIQKSSEEIYTTETEYNESRAVSSQYYRSIKGITSGQKSIIFPRGSEELPAQFIPDYNGDFISKEEAERIAKGDNMMLRYTWDKDGIERVVKSNLLFSNKNSIDILSLEWDRKVVKMLMRVVGYYDKDGNPVEYKLENFFKDGVPVVRPPKMYDSNGNSFGNMYKDGIPVLTVLVEKPFVVCDNPHLERHPAKNCYFDLTIEDPMQWQCFIREYQKSFESLLNKQYSGEYTNVEKLCDAQLFDAPEHTAENVDDEQSTFADINRSGVDRRNGLYKVFHIQMYAPINDKGKWDKDAIPKLYEAVIAGDMNAPVDNIVDGKSKGAVVLQLRRFPYAHNMFTYWPIYSHDDDRRSAIRMGYETILRNNYEIQTACLRQWEDNKNRIIRAQKIIQGGALSTSDMTSSASKSKVLVTRRGIDPKSVMHTVPEQNVTQLTVQELGFMGQDANDITGMTEAMRGAAMGSRTTSTEYQGAITQGMKPAIEDAKFMADQIFPRMLMMIASMWRQFGEPGKVINITDGDVIIGQVDPTDLYGMSNIRVVGVDRFESDVLQRNQMIQFLNNGFAYAKESMGPEGETAFWRRFAESFRMRDAEKIFPEGNMYVEAERQAWNDINTLMNDPYGALNSEGFMPEQGENHKVQLNILKPYRENLNLMAKVNPAYGENLRVLDILILAHEQMLERSVQMAMQNQQAQSAQPVNTGEVAGDQLGGLVGGVA